MLVVGCSGGGKSTLARALSAALDLPYISMDRAFFWLPGWVLRERSQIREMIGEAVAQERWIMDGTSPGTFDLRLPRADLVIWLRLPRLACLANVVRRRIRYAGRTRPEMAEGCPEKLDLEFLRYIWSFEEKMSPQIDAALRSGDGSPPVFVLTSRRDAEMLLARVARRR